MVIKGGGNFFQQQSISGRTETLSRSVKMRRNFRGDSVVKQLAVLLDDKVVGIAVKFFEAQDGGVAQNDFVNCICKTVPNRLRALTIHLNPCPERLDDYLLP
mmetsp:Transcript_5278/g.8086  ORF Transcript_5278/g.8086 Transcript_5278/m.8086 type:complete len:102 (-) Transcript_5278:94-399(-)